MKTIDSPPAKFGYIITGSRDVTGQTCFGLGVIDEDGDYEPAEAGEDGNPLAVYPTAEAASDAMHRACGDTDPAIYDGLEVVPAWKAVKDNGSIAECVVYDWLAYPAGKPARTDWTAAL